VALTRAQAVVLGRQALCGSVALRLLSTWLATAAQVPGRMLLFLHRTSALLFKVVLGLVSISEAVNAFKKACSSWAHALTTSAIRSKGLIAGWWAQISCGVRACWSWAQAPAWRAWRQRCSAPRCRPAVRLGVGNTW